MGFALNESSVRTWCCGWRCFAAPALVFVLDVSDAHAQSRNCQSLANTLASIERSRDFRNLGTCRGQTARSSSATCSSTESKYVRDGCNAAAKRGEKLTQRLPDAGPRCRQRA